MGVGVMVELKVEDIASSIKKLDRTEKEMLLLLLSDKGTEIAKRVRDLKSKKVRPMTREEVFKDVL